MDPYASHIIGQARMKELREQAARHQQAAQAREERPNKFRSAAGSWLISIGEWVLPTPTARPVELHR